MFIYRACRGCALRFIGAADASGWCSHSCRVLAVNSCRYHCVDRQHMPWAIYTGWSTMICWCFQLPPGMLASVSLAYSSMILSHRSSFTFALASSTDLLLHIGLWYTARKRILLPALRHSLHPIGCFVRVLAILHRKWDNKTPSKPTVSRGVAWYARCDSNAWPSESESDTLSNWATGAYGAQTIVTQRISVVKRSAVEGTFCDFWADYNSFCNF